MVFKLIREFICYLLHSALETDISSVLLIIMFFKVISSFFFFFFLKYFRFLSLFLVRYVRKVR